MDRRVQSAVWTWATHYNWAQCMESDDEDGFDVAPDEDLDEDLPMEQGDETQNDFLDETVPDSTAASILAGMRSRPPTRQTASS